MVRNSLGSVRGARPFALLVGSFVLALGLPLSGSAANPSPANPSAGAPRWLVPGVTLPDGGAFVPPFWLDRLPRQAVSFAAATKACAAEGSLLPSVAQVMAVRGPARPLLALPGLETAPSDGPFAWPNAQTEWTAESSAPSPSKSPADPKVPLPGRLAFRCAKLATPAELTAELHRLVKAFPGQTALFAQNANTGKSFGIRPAERVRTASTIKLPILVALAQMVADGDARWDETMELTDRDRVSGSGVLREFADGARPTLRDLAHLMIVVSDNTATNMVLEKVTANRVNRVMDQYGFPNLRSSRKVRGDGKNLKMNPGGESDFYKVPENQKYGLGMATSEEMVRLLLQLHQGKLVTPAASAEMLRILGRQQYTDNIGRHLDGFALASKSGSLDALRSDVALLTGKQATLALAITVDGMQPTDYSPDNFGSFYLSRLAGLLVGLLGPL